MVYSRGSYLIGERLQSKVDLSSEFLELAEDDRVISWALIASYLLVCSPPEIASLIIIGF
jgi:hypothetical protein